MHKVIQSQPYSICTHTVPLIIDSSFLLSSIDDDLIDGNPSANRITPLGDAQFVLHAL